MHYSSFQVNFLDFDDTTGDEGVASIDDDDGIEGFDKFAVASMIRNCSIWKNFILLLCCCYFCVDIVALFVLLLLFLCLHCCCFCVAVVFVVAAAVVFVNGWCAKFSVGYAYLNTVDPHISKPHISECSDYPNPKLTGFLVCFK